MQINKGKGVLGISTKNFIVCFWGTVLSLFFCVGAFNCVIDPYNIWNFYRQVGVNQWTPKAEDLDRLIQPIRFLKARPETIFLGNSQVVWGVDASEYTRITGKSAYNFGMLGASIYEMRRNLEHAIAVDENLNEVYLCVNFELFANNERHLIEQKKPEFDEAQVGHSFMTLENLTKTTFSFKALQDSIATIRDNRKNNYESTYYTPTGRWDNHSIERYCQNRNWTFIASMQLMARADYYYEGMSLNEDCLGELSRIIDLCRQHNICLHVYTMPAHARSMENYAAAWPVYEDWLRRIVEMTPIADYFDYNQYTMSPAEKGKLSENSNPYFWDSHHANVNLTNFVLADLTGVEKLPWGKVLTKENVEAHLQELTAKRLEWERQHPESVEEVRYYTGFSPLTPMDLQGKNYLYGQSVVRLNNETGREKLNVTLKQQDMFDFTGEYLAPHENVKVMYALLESKNGEKYYTFAEVVSSDALAEFMHSREYETCGFHIREPLRKVSKGQYELSLLLVTEDGKVYKSGILADVVVE